MSDEAKKTDERYIVPALERGLQLLFQFSRETPELTGAELARRLDSPRASVFRILYTLEQAGLVERAGDGSNYKLGLGVLRLGFEYLASMELTEYGRPVIEELRDRTGFSAHIVVRDGREVVFVAKAPGRNARFHSIQVGARLPAHGTVLGRLLLSDMDLGDLRNLYGDGPLPAYTPKTPTTINELKNLFDQDRANGYALSMSGFETGISSVAAPVLDERGKVAAVISVSVPSPNIESQDLPTLIDNVKTAAAHLSARISHLPERAA